MKYKANLWNIKLIYEYKANLILKLYWLNVFSSPVLHFLFLKF